MLMLVVAGVNAICATWYTAGQVAALSGNIIQAYPTVLYLTTWAQVFLLLTVLYLFAASTTQYLFRLADVEDKSGLVCAAAWLPLGATIFLTPLRFGVTAGLLILIFGVVWCLRAQGLSALLRKSGKDILALCVIVVAVTVVATIISPLHQSAPLTVYNTPSQGELHIFSPLYKSFINAKAFSFSNFDHAAWGAVPIVPTSLNSLIVPLAALVLDLPSIDVKSFHRLVTSLVHVCIILGSFGFFLYLHRALGIRYFLSLLAGILFVLGNEYFIHGFNGDYLFFVMAYLALPYVLIGMRITILKSSARAAVMTAMAIAAPFYLLAPHPEAFFHFSFIVTFTGLAWLIFSPRKQILRRFGLLSLTAGTALAVSMAFLYPIISVAIRQEAITFGHLSGTFAVDRGNMIQSILPLVSIAGVFGIVAVAAQLGRGKLMPDAWGVGVACLLVGNVLVEPFQPYIAHLLELSGLPIYFNAYHRIMIYIAFGALLWSVLGFNTLLDLIKQAGHFCYRLAVLRFEMRSIQVLAGSLAFGCTIVVWLAAILLTSNQIDRRNYLKSGTKNGNPQGCAYYISLGAHLSNLQGLEDDAANIEFIHHKMLAFEQFARRNSLNSELQAYRTRLYTFGATRAHDLKLNDIESAAHAVAPLIDEAHLGDKACVYPPITHGWSWNAPDRIVRYNNDSLFQNLPSPFLRILGATGRRGEGPRTNPPLPFEDPRTVEAPRVIDSHLALGSGRLIINSTTTLDSRFMMGQPFVHALFLYPGYIFPKRGTYYDLMSWKLDAREVLTPDARHLLNIAGVDVFTVREEDLIELPIKGVSVIPYKMPRQIDPRYRVLRNGQSNGLAFVATAQQSIPSAQIQEWETQIKQYFRREINAKSYRAVLSSMKDALGKLGRREVLLGSDDAQNLEETGMPGDRKAAGDSINGAKLTIVDIIGGQAAFNVTCPQEQCLVVFNTAYFGGWHAYVDGTRTNAVRANLAFLGASVPQGNHDLVFSFRPTANIVAAFISLIVVIAGLGWVWSVGGGARHKNPDTVADPPVGRA